MRYVLFALCLLFSYYASAQNSEHNEKTCNNANHNHESHQKKEVISTGEIGAPPPYLDDNIAKYFKEQYRTDIFKEFPTYPRYIHRGLGHEDIADYHKRVDEWMAKNPQFQAVLDRVVEQDNSHVDPEKPQ